MRRGMVVFIVGLFWYAPLNAAQEPVELHLDLNTVIAKASQVALGVLLADARVQGAVAELQRARAPLLPQVTGVLTGERQTKDLRASGLSFPGVGPSVGPFNTFDARGRVVQTIFDGGAFERLHAARLGEKLSKLELEKAKEDALALAATMYISAKRAREHQQAVYAVLRKDHLSYRLQFIKLHQGTGSSTALKQARANYLKTRYAFELAKTTALEKLLDLKALLKIPADVHIVFDQGRYAEALGRVGSKDVPVNLRDVETAQAKVNVQEAQVKAAMADFGPRISLFGDYGRAGQTPDRGSNTYAVGLQATVPIWEGGIKTANLKEAKAQAKESAAFLDDARYQAANKITDAEAALKDARLLIVASMADVAAAQEVRSDISQRVKSGIGNQLDLVTANAQLMNSMDEYKEALAVYWLAKIQLAHVQGQMELFLK